jgi:hypothetical protein
LNTERASSEHVAHLRREALAQRRGHEVAPHLCQQVVLEMIAQPGERTAHRRLAAIDAPSGMCGVFDTEQRIERHEQVQVELFHAHKGLRVSCPGIHAPDTYNPK